MGESDEFRANYRELRNRTTNACTCIRGTGISTNISTVLLTPSLRKSAPRTQTNDEPAQYSHMHKYKTHTHNKIFIQQTRCAHRSRTSWREIYTLVLFVQLHQLYIHLHAHVLDAPMPSSADAATFFKMRIIFKYLNVTKRKKMFFLRMRQPRFWGWWRHLWVDSRFYALRLVHCCRFILV